MVIHLSKRLFVSFVSRNSPKIRLFQFTQTIRNFGFDFRLGEKEKFVFPLSKKNDIEKFSAHDNIFLQSLRAFT